jgi:hypothetical protein
MKKGGFHNIRLMNEKALRSNWITPLIEQLPTALVSRSVGFRAPARLDHPTVGPSSGTWRAAST